MSIEKSWNTEQLQREFTVHGFCMGMVDVTRKSDGVRGTMDFDHMPRVYYNFKEDVK
jgi:hypothetical protein